MPSEISQPISPTSARSLRQSLKQNQASDMHLRAYLSFGQALFEQGWESSAITLLRTLSALLSAEHALLTVENAGKLIIHTQLGQTLPVGTRVPMMGILATMLKNPVQFEVYENKAATLWTHGDVQLHECLVPIALGKQGKGILAFSGKKLTLTSAEIETLQAFAGILSLAIIENNGPALSDSDQSILNTLTPREREIFALLPAGLSNNELGTKLGIAAGTAKIHVERVLNKLGVKDRTQAAVKAVELGYSSSLGSKLIPGTKA